MKNKSKVILTIFMVCVPFILSSLLLTSCNKQRQLDEVEFIIDWEPGIDYIGYYVADEKGFYEDEGIKIQFKHVNGAPLSAELIGLGKAFIGTTTADQVILARAKKEGDQSSETEEEGLSIKAVATIFSQNPIVITSLDPYPISKIEKLNGKKLGMNAGSVTYKQYLLIEKNEKYNLKSVQHIDIGWGETEQLLHGQINALLAYVMERPVSLRLQLIKENDKRKVHVLSLKDIDPSLNIIGQVIAAYEPALADPRKRNLVEKVVRASLKGWDYVKKYQGKEGQPQDPLTYYRKRYPTQEKKYLAGSLKETLPLVPTEVTKYGINEADWSTAITAMEAMEIIKEGTYVPFDFYIKLDQFQ